MQAAPSSNLTLNDIQSDSISTYFGGQVHWKPEVVEDIFQKELEPSNFSVKKLAILEHHQYLENVKIITIYFGSSH
jgi:hypothetical protein